MLGSIKYLVRYKNHDGKRISKDQQKNHVSECPNSIPIVSDSEPEKN